MLQQKGGGGERRHVHTYNTSLMSDSAFSLFMWRLMLVGFSRSILRFCSIALPSLLYSILCYVFVLEFRELAHCGHVPSVHIVRRQTVLQSDPLSVGWTATGPPPAPSPAPTPPPPPPAPI